MGERTASRTAALPAAPPTGLATALGAWLLLIAALVIYWPALAAGYVWDDHAFVADNPLMRDWRGLARLWASTEPVDYWPLMYSSFWLERRLFGLDPFLSHLINVVLHAGAGIVLYRLLAALGLRFAWCAALLFVVHPLNVDAVGNIFQRKTIMAGLFAFAAVLMWWRARETGDRRWLVGALAAFACALLSKTSPVGLPVALALIVWWRNGRFSRRDGMEIGAFALVALVLGGVGWWFQARTVGYDSFAPDAPIARIAAAGQGLAFYARATFWPSGLSFVYPRWEIAPGDPAEYLPFAATVAVALVLLFASRRFGRGPLTATAIFAVALAPVLGLVDLMYFNFARVADRFAYLALPAALAPVCHAAGTLAAARGGAARLVAFSATTLVIAIAARLAFAHAFVYGDEERIWRAMTERHPQHWVSFGNLGVLRAGKGDLSDAERLLLRARDLAPANAVVRFNLGVVAGLRGDAGNARRHYTDAILLRPQSAAPRINLAHLDVEAGDFAAAETQLRQAVAAEPEAAVAAFDLATVLLARGRASEARALFGDVAEREPEFAPAHIGLAMSALALRDSAAAATHLDRAAGLAASDDPDVAAARRAIERASRRMR